MKPVNRARGETLATLAGESVRLCLTLGALAEIETALALGEGERLADRLRTVSARDVSAILTSLLKGGGVDEDRASHIAAQAAPAEAAGAVALAFEAAARP